MFKQPSCPSSASDGRARGAGAGGKPLSPGPSPGNTSLKNPRPSEADCGDVIKAAIGTDLIEAALSVAENKTRVAQTWLAEGRIARAEMGDAEDWHARQPMFWAVVVAPWVLVQEVVKQLDS